MKKLLAALLALALVCALTACTAKKPAEKDTDAGTMPTMPTMGMSEVILPEDVFD